MTVEERVKKIITTNLGVRSADIRLTSSLTNDLGADSVDRVELVMSIEDEFKITVPDTAECKLQTVQDLITFIENKRE
mgnify:CR=1 FL=1